MGHGLTYLRTLSTRAAGLLVLLALAAAPPVAAGNGRIALLFPVDGITVDGITVDGITVDGDLAEWPAHAERYPIRLAESGQRPTDREDFAASFRAGYSQAEGSLYLGIEVTDESSVIDAPTPANYNTRDGCEIFLHLVVDHVPWGCQFALWGDDTRHFSTLPGFRGMPGMPAPPGVPALAGMPQMFGAYQVRATHAPGRHVYEWRIDVDHLTRGAAQLSPGLEIGLDVVVDDMDADGSFSWMAWGWGTQKLGAPRRMGQGLLVGQGEGLARAVDRAAAMSEASYERALDHARERTAYQMFFTGVLLSVTFLHLLLFLYYRQIRTNLYYALFSGVAGGLIYYGFHLSRGGLPTFFGPTGSTGANEISALIVGEALLLVCVLGLLFLYSLFYPRLPRQFWVLLAFLVATGVTGYLFVFEPGVIDRYMGLLGSVVGFAILGTAIEFLRVVLRAVRRRQEGAWMMGVSFLAFGGAGIYGTTQLMDRGPIDNALLFAVLLPLASMSVYLARSVARTRRALEVQNRALELANERIRQQSAQVQEANRLKSDFLARMSHDLRTPLNAIIGYTRIILRRTRDTLEERQYQNLQNISISADNLLALINDILDLSRIEAGRTEIQLDDVDLGQLASQCAAAIESLVPEGVELRRQLDPVPPVRTDADRVRRVLTNLLGNAVKYTEAGHIALSLRSVDGGVELAVADTGAGIPPEDLPHIFDEFRQVERRDKKREGSGLGLAIARRSVEMLGGTIRAESQVGVGSTFTVHLGDAPLAESGPTPAADTPTTVPVPEPPPA